MGMQQKQNLTEGYPGGGDDVRTSNMRIAQRKHDIPHSMMKNMTCVTGSVIQ